MSGHRRRALGLASILVPVALLGLGGLTAPSVGAVAPTQSTSWLDTLGLRLSSPWGPRADGADALAATTGGRVYREFNLNGIADGPIADTTLDIWEVADPFDFPVALIKAYVDEDGANSEAWDNRPIAARYAEAGLPGIEVRIYDDCGLVPLNSGSFPRVTDTNGDWTADYTLNPGCAANSHVLVEFSIPPSLAYLSTGPVGSDNASSVVRVPVGTPTVDFTVGSGSLHADDDPQLGVVQFIGERGYNAGLGAFTQSLLVSSYFDAGPLRRDSIDPNSTAYHFYNGSAYPAKASLTPQADYGVVGNVYGSARDPLHERVLLGAFERAYSRLGGGSAGPNPNPFVPLFDGEAAIYQLDDAGNESLWLDLEDVLGEGVAGTDPSYSSPIPIDTAEHQLIGHMGLGDLEFSLDGKRLFVVNLKTLEVYAIPVQPDGTADTTAIETWPLPDPSNNSGWDTDGNANTLEGGWDIDGDGSVDRPYRAALGLEIHPIAGWLYATVTSTGPLAANVKGYVYSLDPDAASPSFSLALDAGTFPTQQNTNGNSRTSSPWRVVSNYSGSADWQPWLADVSFDMQPDGQIFMVLGSRNRLLDMVDGSQQAEGGALRLACDDGGGGWQVEAAGTGVCGSRTTEVPNAGYFFNRRQEGYGFFDFQGKEGPYPNGAVIALPGYTEYAASGTDNVESFGQSGVAFLRRAVGTRTRDSRFYTANENLGNAFKSNPWGDVLIMSGTEGPLEIGNLVWNDADLDGVQDATEAGIAGVTVSLYLDTDGDGDEDQKVAEALTDGLGQYYFRRNVGGDTGTVNNGPGFQAGENLEYYRNYVIVLDQASDFSSGPLVGLSPSPANAAAGGDSDGSTDQNAAINSGAFANSEHATARAADGSRDSDGESWRIALSTGAPGQSEHGYDLGAGEQVEPTATPTSTAVPPTATATSTAAGSTPTPGALLKLGNLVFFDLDNDGLYEPGSGEFPLDGVLLNLYLDDGDGVLDAGDGAPSASATTALGMYMFGGLPAGDYLVQVDPSNFDPGGTLDGLQTSAGNDIAGMAPDPDDDLNNDDNGTMLAGLGVAAKAVTLSLDAEPVSDGDTDPNTNLTVDFGFIRPAPPTGLTVAGLSVEATVDGAGALLRWRTLREEGLVGFRVERSLAGSGVWEPVAEADFVVSKGLRGGASYRVLDRARPGSGGGLTLYRVWALAEDGSRWAFGPVGLAIEDGPTDQGQRAYLPQLGRGR